MASVVKMNCKGTKIVQDTRTTFNNEMRKNTFWAFFRFQKMATLHLSVYFRNWPFTIPFIKKMKRSDGLT